MKIHYSHNIILKPMISILRGKKKLMKKIWMHGHKKKMLTVGIATGHDYEDFPFPKMNTY